MMALVIEIKHEIELNETKDVKWKYKTVSICFWHDCLTEYIKTLTKILEFTIIFSKILLQFNVYNQYMLYSISNQKISSK